MSVLAPGYFVRDTSVMRRWSFIVVLLLLAIVGMGVWQSQLDYAQLEAWIGAHRFWGAAAYVMLLATSVVALPFSSLPLLPLAARLFGVFWTGVLSVLGWWIGCLIAFRIARMGRRMLEHFISWEAVDRIERAIPPDIGFAGIVVLRMILPVDVTSFALGLLRRLRFGPYALASLLGITPFAFVWSAAGGAIGSGRWIFSLLLLCAMTLGVLAIRRRWLRKSKNKTIKISFDKKEP